MPSTDAPAREAATSSDDVFPDAFGLVLDAGTSVSDGGRVLVGGSPRRVVRLTATGAAVLAERLARCSAAPPVAPAAARLARRLVDVGVAHPLPPTAAADVGDVTVVVPVRDRPVDLARCLRALGDDCRIIVVDDGSTDPDAVRAATDPTNATLIRRQTSGGPAAARNTALRQVSTPLVAFVDSDCVPPPAWLEPLVPHFADRTVVAVAPRVRGRVPGAAATAPRPALPDAAVVSGEAVAGRISTVARWGAARSPLDLGDRPARVVPGTVVSYVPTAALVVRTTALGRGFDPALRHGEDVDLVWRLYDAGGRLRYEPGVVVEHAEPTTATTFFGRRFRYGTSAGPLARRHGDRLAPLVVAPRTACTVALLLAGRPRLAALLLIEDVARAERALRGPGIPQGTGALAALRAAGSTVDGLSKASTMFALPALVGLALARPSVRRRAAAVVLVSPLAEWFKARRTGRTAGLGPVRWTLCRIADDVAYGTGVWVGAARSREPRAVLPVTIRAGARTPTGPST